MPIKLTAPIYETFELDEIDAQFGEQNEDATVITVRQATQYHHEQRQGLMGSLERKFRAEEPEHVSLIQNFSLEELMREEVWLTLCESNIQDEDGSPLFPSKQTSEGRPVLAMRKHEFYKAWGKLPPVVANAIHKRVIQVNIMWSGQGEEL